MDILRRLPPEQRLAAASAALPHASPGEREPIALAIIEIASLSDPGHGAAARGAVRTLLEHWREAPVTARRVALAACRGAWREAASALDEGAVLRAGASLAEHVIDSSDPAVAALLPAVLESSETGAVALAAQAVLALAVRLTGESDPVELAIDRQSPALRPMLDPEVTPWTEDDLERFVGAVVRAVESFETHRRKELLLAAILLLERPRGALRAAASLQRLVADSDAAAGRTVRSALRRAKAPIARRRAWLWMREPAVAAACMERIARAPTVADHAAVLALGHLVLAPARASQLRFVPIATRPAPPERVPPGVENGVRRLHAEGPAPDRVVLQLLGFAPRRMTPRFVASLDGDHASRDLALDPFLTDPDPLARFNAARVASPAGARDFCFDGCEAIARAAAIAASPCGVPESGRLRAGDGARRRFAESLARSAHAPVRRVGAEDRDRITPGSRGPAQTLAARRAFAADRSTFVDWVRDTVRGEDSDAAVAALMTARRIRVVAEVEPLALSIIRASLTGRDGAPERLVATAVACLGDLRAGRAVGVLAECLRRHPDARVRANAAEALGRSRRAVSSDGVIAECVGDEHHRVRASVVRTLLAPLSEPKSGWVAQADPIGALASMLGDDRAAHRLAGVWVVHRSLGAGMRGMLGREWAGLTARVRWLAESDEDRGVRTRAGAVIQRLDAAVAGIGPRSAGRFE